MPYTYQDLIRKYSSDVERGIADTDLTPRQRRLVVGMLNTASNAGRAVVVYPPTDDTRTDVARHLGNVLWDSIHLIRAALPAKSEDADIARDRALTILRDM